MNIEHWPKVVPPDGVVEEYKKEVASNQEFFKDMVDAEMLSTLSKDSLAQAEYPCPLIRAKWGGLIALEFPSGAEIRAIWLFRYMLRLPGGRRISIRRNWLLKPCFRIRSNVSMQCGEARERRVATV